MFKNNNENRGYVKEIADEFDLDLVDPEIFLRFLDEDEFYIKNWSDVEREMIQLTGNNINMSGLKRQYKLCGYMLSVRGYSIDRAKL